MQLISRQWFYRSEYVARATRIKEDPIKVACVNAVASGVESITLDLPTQIMACEMSVPVIFRIAWFIRSGGASEQHRRAE